MHTRQVLLDPLQMSVTLLGLYLSATQIGLDHHLLVDMGLLLVVFVLAVQALPGILGRDLLMARGHPSSELVKILVLIITLAGADATPCVALQLSIPTLLHVREVRVRLLTLAGHLLLPLG